MRGVNPFKETSSDGGSHRGGRECGGGGALSKSDEGRRSPAAWADKTSPGNIGGGDGILWGNKIMRMRERRQCALDGFFLSLRREKREWGWGSGVAPMGRKKRGWGLAGARSSRGGGNTDLGVAARVHVGHRGEREKGGRLTHGWARWSGPQRQV
jgi:hypothetical protein